MKQITIIVNKKKLNLVFGKSFDEWQELYGDDENLWDILFEELVDETLYIDENIWYWYINGRCYETTENVI